MKDYKHIEKRIKKKYHLTDDNIYYHKFYQDLFSGYSYVLGEKQDTRSFYTVEPKNCELRKILKVNDTYSLCYGLEEIISSALCHLAKSGKAYLYLEPKYKENENGIENSEEKMLSELKLSEIVGYPRKRLFGKTVFYTLMFGGGVLKKEIESKQLIVFDLQDMGYRKNTFYSIVSKLDKSDIMKSTKFITEHVSEYDFPVHAKKERMKLLKLSRDFGWLWGTNGLSESYILYKKIQQDKFQITFLSYAIKQINDGIKEFMQKDDTGEIVYHLRGLDYDRLWDDYTKGKKTMTELYNILYQI